MGWVVSNEWLSWLDGEFLARREPHASLRGGSHAGCVTQDGVRCGIVGALFQLKEYYGKATFPRFEHATNNQQASEI